MDERSWSAAGTAPLRLWGAGEAGIDAPTSEILATDLAAQNLLALAKAAKIAEHRAEAAERDRDWWRAQHDAIMEDWRLDVAQAKAASAQAAPETVGPAEAKQDTTPLALGGSADLSDALSQLLQFYDPHDGSIAFHRQGRTLSDAFAQVAQRLERTRS